MSKTQTAKSDLNVPQMPKCKTNQNKKSNGLIFVLNNELEQKTNMI